MGSLAARALQAHRRGSNQYIEQEGIIEEHASRSSARLLGSPYDLQAGPDIRSHQAGGDGPRAAHDEGVDANDG